jgi:hypothetical protein
LLARHHPDEPLFSNRLAKMRAPMEFCKPDLQNEYFNEVAAWIKKTYNVKITYGNFTPYFEMDCTQNKAAIENGP